MTTKYIDTTQLQFINDETDRVQMLVRRTTVEDYADGLDDYRVAFVQIEPDLDEAGEPVENICFSSLNLAECRALRDYLDNVLEEADCESDNSDYFSAAHPVEGFDEEEGDEDVSSCGSDAS